MKRKMKRNEAFKVMAHNFNLPLGMLLREARKGAAVVRRRARLEWERNGRSEPVYLLITASAIDIDGKRYALLVLEDFSEVVELKGLIPICAHCKKIRNDSEYWDQVEVYLSKHLDVDFSHAICPDCMDELYGKSLNRK